MVGEGVMGCVLDLSGEESLLVQPAPGKTLDNSGSRSAAGLKARRGPGGPPHIAAEPQPITSLMNLVLYLSGANAELRDRSGRRRARGNTSMMRTRKGRRMFPAGKPTTREAGWRLGTALRRAAGREHRGGQGGSHASRARPALRAPSIEPHARSRHALVVLEYGGKNTWQLEKNDGGIIALPIPAVSIGWTEERY